MDCNNSNILYSLLTLVMATNCVIQTRWDDTVFGDSAIFRIAITISVSPVLTVNFIGLTIRNLIDTQAVISIVHPTTWDFAIDTGFERVDTFV